VNLAYVPRELRASVKEACRRGWICTQSKHGHIRLFKEGAGCVFISKSMSDHRAQKNVLADLRKRGAIG